MIFLGRIFEANGSIKLDMFGVCLGKNSVKEKPNYVNGKQSLLREHEIFIMGLIYVKVNS